MLENKLGQEFMDYLRKNGKSENTQRNYRNNLNLFFKEITKIRTDVKSLNDIYELRKLEVKDIDALKVYLEEVLNRKRNYINNIIATVSSFYSYLKKAYEDECVIKNIAKISGQMVAHRSESTFLEKDEALKLLKTANVVKCDKDEKRNLRNELIINLFLNTGIRCTELRNLEFKNIIEEDNYIVFFGKGGKERGLYLNDKTMDLYKAWKKERAEFVSEKKAKEGHENKVFLSRNRSAISLKQINRILDNYCTQADIEKHITSHKLRHTVATMFLKEGNKSLEEVADILGHSSTDTTRRYSHITDDNKKLTRYENPLFN